MHFRPLSTRRLAPPAVAGLALFATAGLAAASTLTASPVVRVPDNPLGGSATCAALVAHQESLGSKNFPDAEVEPYVAVDPTNPQHLIGSMQQDRWSDGGSNGLTNVVSTDGGQSWQLAAGQPPFSVCEGATSGSPGDLNRATDPWVSFSADGQVGYSISDSFNADGPGFGGASSIIISRSTDGGHHWQTPVTAIFTASTQALNDKESVTADPVQANKAYAVWDQLVSPQTNANPSAFAHSIAFRGPSYFSATTDKGASWSPGRVIFDPGQNDQTIGNQIVVPTSGPAAGVLIDGLNLITNKGGICPYTHGGQHCNGNSTNTAAILRSTDGGATWSGATGIDVMVPSSVTIAGQSVRSGDGLPEFATNPVTGALYAVWQDGRFGGTAKIAFAQSTDGGRTWSDTIRIDGAPNSAQAFLPQIHVAPDGTVGVSYFDTENATAQQPGNTDAFLVHCHSGTTDCANPANWASGETRLSNSGSFDYTTAAKAGGLFLGDYQGLTSSGNNLVAFFGMSRPIATAGPSDIFSTRVG